MGFVRVKPSLRWANGVIPFTIHPSIFAVSEDAAAVVAAIATWNAKMCLPFVERTVQDDFAEFIRLDGVCKTHFGRQGGRQQIGCDFATIREDKPRLVLHEMAHAAGLLHEHQRPDRDANVLVSSRALESKKRDFERLSGDSDVVVGRYDCRSITHYYSSPPGLIASHPLGCVSIGPDRDDPLTAGDVSSLLYLYPFKRRADSGNQAGDASELAVVNLATSELLTAVRTAEGNLKLIAWGVGLDGRITRLGDSRDQAGEATAVSIDRNFGSGGRFITACRTDEGRLRLISWRVGGDSTARTITREGDSADEGPRADAVALVCIPGSARSLTAIKTSAGRLKLLLWSLDSDNDAMHIVSESNETTEHVEEVALVEAQPAVFVTPVRTSQGRLKILRWRVRSDDEIVMEEDIDGVAENASLIRAVAVHSQGALPRVYVSYRDADSRLRISVWQSQALGLTFLGDSGTAAGVIGENALVVEGTTNLLSAVRTAQNQLRLIRWTVNVQGGIARTGDTGDLGGGVGGRIAVPRSRVLTGPALNIPFVLTCALSASGELRLVSWSPCGESDRA